MENFPLPSLEPAGDNQAPIEPQAPVFPPKYQKQEKPPNIWIKSFTSLALYLLLGYYIFHSFRMLLMITAIIVFHELGHFFAMKFFRYKDLGIFFIPLLGAYVSGSKREVSQKESAVILLAGPLPGIILGIAFYLLWLRNNELNLADISFYTIALSLIFLNLINLLPIYPLDGGQLLNRVFLDEETWMSKIFLFLSVGLLCWFAIFRIGIPYGIPLLIFPAMMLMRIFGDSKLNNIEKVIESKGISLDHSYDELPDEDYWKIRNILIEEYPACRDIPPAPPYVFNQKEERIMTTIQSLLHRHLIQDMNLMGKLLVLLTCIAAFAAPWFLDIDMTFFRRLGF